MVRTQIYLTRREHERVQRLARRNGTTQSEVIRAALDFWLDHKSDQGRAEVLESVAGLWRDRKDLPDFAALRREADRIPPRR